MDPIVKSRSKVGRMSPEKKKIRKIFGGTGSPFSIKACSVKTTDQEFIRQAI
jgi:hypothetical protein